MILWTPRSQDLTTLPAEFLMKSYKVFIDEEFHWWSKMKMKKNHRFLSWKRSYRHWECTFDNIAEKFLQPSRISFAQCQIPFKKIEVSGDKTYFPRKIHLDTQNAVSKTLPNFLDKDPYSSAQCPKMKKVKKFQTRFFPENYPMDTDNSVSTTLPKSFGNEANVFI